MKGIFKEFKTFISKGNVFDLAVGIIIGSAFGKIVASFVADLFMPFIGLIIGNQSLTNMKVVLHEASGDTEELAIRYGQFIQTFIDFILIAIVVFIMVKFINKLKKKEIEKPTAPAEPTEEVLLLSEIRDILKRQ